MEAAQNCENLYQEISSSKGLFTAPTAQIIFAEKEEKNNQGQGPTPGRGDDQGPPWSLPENPFAGLGPPSPPPPPRPGGPAADVQTLQKCKTREAEACEFPEPLRHAASLPTGSASNTRGLAKDGTVLLGAPVSPAARLSWWRWRSCSAGRSGLRHVRTSPTRGRGRAGVQAGGRGARHLSPSRGLAWSLFPLPFPSYRRGVGGGFPLR